MSGYPVPPHPPVIDRHHVRNMLDQGRRAELEEQLAASLEVYCDAVEAYVAEHGLAVYTEACMELAGKDPF